MKFIKSILKSIKDFFVNLFSNKKQEQELKEIEEGISLHFASIKNSLQEMDELIADIAPETLDCVTEIDLECGKIFDHILQMSKQYGYPLHEALQAYIANDKEKLLTIETQMVDRLYDNIVKNSPTVDRFLDRKEKLRKHKQAGASHLRLVQ